MRRMIGYLAPDLLSLDLLLLDGLLLHTKALDHTACFAGHLVYQATLFVVLLPACTFS